MTKYYYDLNNAIKTIHSKHGKGDIKEIRRFADGRLEIEACRTSCEPHISRGRIVSEGRKTTIRIYGHQFTIRLIG